MSPLPARDRLRAFLVKHPRATATQASKALGVSRQLVHRLANEEELELGRSVDESIGAGDLGTMVAPPAFTAEASTGAGEAQLAAVLRVAADLTARGYEVYLPSHGETSHRLVAHDPGTGRFEGVSVEITKKGPRQVHYAAAAARGLTALVGPDQSIDYRPPLT